MIWRLLIILFAFIVGAGCGGGDKKTVPVDGRVLAFCADGTEILNPVCGDACASSSVLRWQHGCRDSPGGGVIPADDLTTNPPPAVLVGSWRGIYSGGGIQRNMRIIVQANGIVRGYLQRRQETILETGTAGTAYKLQSTTAYLSIMHYEGIGSTMFGGEIYVNGTGQLVGRVSRTHTSGNQSEALSEVDLTLVRQ